MRSKWEAGTVNADYSKNRQDATATQIEDSALATAMLETARKDVLNWIGTPTELLEELGRIVGKKVTSSARWPKSPVWMSNELRPRLAPATSEPRIIR